MPTYTPPLKDLEFVLHDVLRVHECKTPGYNELDREFTGAILEEAGKIARDVLTPINAIGDSEGCTLENGVVHTPTGFKEAFDIVRDGGWTGLGADTAYGGQGMPYVLGASVTEMLVSANLSFNMYQGLTNAAYEAIHAHGSEEIGRAHV